MHALEASAARISRKEQALIRCHRWLLLWLAAMTACDKRPPPPVVEPAPAETINGTERLGWTQAAADAVELGTFRYALYVDGGRVELGGVSCTPLSAAPEYSCAARLPSMSAGSHTLELAAFVVDGTLLESGRSAPLRVTVTPAAAPAAPPSTRWPTGLEVVTTDRVRLRLEQVADGLVDPTDLAFAPDGRVFIAEHKGTVRVFHDGRLDSEPALSLPATGSNPEHLLALAVDPGFERTHLVYAIYTTTSRSGDAMFSLARFREASNTLADRIILLDEIRASPGGAAASLRFGADGKLFAAFDDGGVEKWGGDLSSPNGKILRLNPDGTTPADQAGGTPLYSYAYRSPGGLDWSAPSNTLWIADRDLPGAGRLSAVASERPRIRGVVRGRFALPRGTVPSAVASYRGGSIPAFRGNLLIASNEGRHLLRVQLDPLQPTHVVATERLLQDRIGGVRLVAVGPDGAIWVANAHAVGKLVARSF